MVMCTIVSLINKGTFLAFLRKVAEYDALNNEFFDNCLTTASDPSFSTMILLTLVAHSTFEEPLP